MWSFVKKKENQQWIRLASDTKTREIVGIDVGGRESAKELWKYLPPVYRRVTQIFGRWSLTGVI